MTSPPDKIRPIRFATLGPAGSNHEFVIRRYLDFHGLHNGAEVELVLDFQEGATRLIGGEIDFMLQVAVHPDAADVVARNRHAMFVVDAFVSGSRPMAVVCRRDVERPAHLALQPATTGYIDACRYGRLIDEVSTASVAAGLLDGRYQAGLTYAAVAEEHPTRFRVLEMIGTVDDAWMVYGRHRLSQGRLLADPLSPAARAYASMRRGTR